MAKRGKKNGKQSTGKTAKLASKVLEINEVVRKLKV